MITRAKRRENSTTCSGAFLKTLSASTSNHLLRGHWNSCLGTVWSRQWTFQYWYTSGLHKAEKEMANNLHSKIRLQIITGTYSFLANSSQATLLSPHFVPSIVWPGSGTSKPRLTEVLLKPNVKEKKLEHSSSFIFKAHHIIDITVLFLSCSAVRATLNNYWMRFLWYPE